MRAATGRLARDRSLVVQVIWIAIVAVACLAADPSSATVVKPFTFDGLVQGAVLIIEGRVTQAEARQEEGSRFIWTDVTFEILDTMKGAWPSHEIRLPFLGGQIGDRALRVSDLQIPEVGETGVYFIANTDGRHTQPLLGWHQGHMVIKKDFDGEQRVFTPDRQSITDIDGKWEPVAQSISPTPALGVHTSSSRTATAISLATLKSAIRERLASTSAQSRHPIRSASPPTPTTPSEKGSRS